MCDEAMRDLFELCNISGVSGFELEIGEKIKEIFSTHCEKTEIDALGNVVGIIGEGNKKRVMLEAHIDEIGLMVKNIDENGFVSFAEIGGINPSVLPSSEVIIHGRERIYGVIGAKPPHLQSEEESEKRYKTDELFIDTGFNKEIGRASCRERV